MRHSATSEGGDVLGLARSPNVGILLCTLNGAQFLPQQLASIERQRFENWRLLASDDGSSDATRTILAQFQQRFPPGKIEICDGPRRGFVRNFLSVAANLGFTCDYYAFSDQDDVWEADKLSRALAFLSGASEAVPAFYCSRTRLIDEEGREIGFSPLFRKPPSFSNALVQSIAGGNTMVFNGAARELLATCSSVADVPAHDWLLYLVTTAAGGMISYDAYPSVRYRVHSSNLIGSNVGWLNRCIRIRMLIGGRFRRWTEQNIKALMRLDARMRPENREKFRLFCQARNRTLRHRVIGMVQSGIHRQTFLGNLGLMFAVLTKKL